MSAGLYTCSYCGNFFNIEDESAFIHPNLFGGVDKLCAKCANKEEKAHTKRLDDTRREFAKVPWKRNNKIKIFFKEKVFTPFVVKQIIMLFGILTMLHIIWSVSVGEKVLTSGIIIGMGVYLKFIAGITIVILVILLFMEWVPVIKGIIASVKTLIRRIFRN